MVKINIQLEKVCFINFRPHGDTHTARPGETLSRFSSHDFSWMFYENDNWKFLEIHQRNEPHTRAMQQPSSTTFYPENLMTVDFSMEVKLVFWDPDREMEKKRVMMKNFFRAHSKIMITRHILIIWYLLQVKYAPRSRFFLLKRIKIFFIWKKI